MSSKSFITRGLALIHLFFLIIFVSAFWDFAKHAVVTDGRPEILLSISFLAFTAGFLLLCWKHIQATGRRKTGMIWALLFLIASLPVGTVFGLIYTNSVLYGDMFINMIKAGTLLEPQNKALFMAWSIPGVYLGFWGFFATLFFLGRDPKAPSKSRWFARFTGSASAAANSDLHLKHAA